MDISIERAAAEDAPEILALQKAAFRSEAELYNDFSIEPLAQTLESLVEQFSTHVMLKAVHGNRIVGSVRARCEGDVVFVEKLVVAPEFQGRGIGTLLMRAVESAFGNKTFVLWTGSRSERNIGLYRKLGYETTGETRNQGNVTLIRFVKSRSTRFSTGRTMD